MASSTRSGRVPTFTDVFIVGFILSITSFLFGEILSGEEAKLITNVIIVIGIIIGGSLIRKGFNYDKIRFSFLWSFLSIVGLIYLALIILIDAYGVLRDIAVLLSPFNGVTIIGYLKSRIWGIKTRPRPVRGIGIGDRVKSTLHQLDATMWMFLIVGMGFLLLFLVVPIFMVLAAAFTPPAGGNWWDNFINVLRSPSYVRLTPLPGEKVIEDLEIAGDKIVRVIKGVDYGAVLNSLMVATIVTISSTILGIVVAYVLARYRFKGHMLLRILAIVPLFWTPFVNSYIIKIMFGDGGPISQLVYYLTGRYLLRIDGLAGVIVAQIISLYPIVYLNAYNSFLNIDPSTEEQAENLGAHGWKLFFTVTLPLALPGIVAGSTLVFIFSMEDLGAPIVFNVRSLMSYKIYDGIISATGQINPEIAALGVVMLLLSVVMFLAIRNYVSMRSYAMISRGGRWSPRIRTLGWRGHLLVYLLMLPLVLYTIFPQIGVGLMALNVLRVEGNSFVLSMPASTSELLKWFNDMVIDPEIPNMFRNTIVYASISVVIAVIISTAVGYSVSRLKVKWLSNFLDALATSPLAIPGLVVALGYYIMFSQLPPVRIGGFVLDLSPVSPNFAAWLVFIIAFSVRRLPYVVRSVYAGFQQVHENLEEAAMNLGATRMRVVFGVILPFIIGYILSGALIGFIYMATEVSTSITFGGISRHWAPVTLAMRDAFGGLAGKGPQVAAAMGFTIMMLQLAIVLVIVYVFKQRYAFIGV